MHYLKSRLAALGLLVGIFVAGFGSGTAVAAQGHMLNARMYLNYALTNLNQAMSDKAGHRVQAINLVKEAIQQVNLGIQAGAN